MDFYTNFEQFKDKILIRGIENGIRVSHKLPLRPYLFTTTKEETEYRSLMGKPMGRVDFENIYEANAFRKQWDGVAGYEIHGMTQWSYPFINDYYPGTIEFDPTKVVVANLDLECLTNNNGFPDPEKADNEITAITVEVGDTYHVFGCKHYVSKSPNVYYYKGADEAEMLKKFLTIWRRLNPDIFLGFNNKGFDVPYLVNRIIKVLGVEYARQLSPWNMVRETSYKDSFNNERQTFELVGIAILDYLLLYKKFSFTPQESYKLDHLAHVILGDRKIPYTEYGNLDRLYHENYEMYVDYNIKDVNLVTRLDRKLGFLALVYSLAYDAKVNYADTMGTTRFWDVEAHNYLLGKKIVAPPATKSFGDTQVEGGHVKDPKTGQHRWIVSFDFTSLYPKLIETFNISPETLVGVRPGVDVSVCLKQSRDNSDIKERNVSMTANGAMFRRDVKGFAAELMSIKFKERDDWKKKMLAAKQRFKETNDPADEQMIGIAHNQQLARKVSINSFYGALANEYFRYFDVRLAEAVTSSGRLAIQWVEKNINIFLNKEFGTTGIDYVIYADTDSLYVTLDTLVQNGREGGFNNTDEIVSFVDAYANDVLQGVINSSTDEVVEYMNAYENSLFMKREAICDAGVWTGKKRYFLSVYDLEGLRYKEPEFKVTGLEAVRSTTPQAVKKYIKDSLPIMVHGTEVELQQFVTECRKDFMSRPVEDIAMAKSANGLEKYRNPATIYQKGCPMQVRAALLYNNALNVKKLNGKYETIKEGDKIKTCYLKMPNPISENVIAVPGFLPRELGLDQYIDYNMMWSKLFIEPVQRMLDTFQWSTEPRASLASLFL